MNNLRYNFKKNESDFVRKYEGYQANYKAHQKSRYNEQLVHYILAFERLASFTKKLTQNTTIIRLII